MDPLNPPVAVVLMVEVAALPALTAAGAKADAEMVKSGGGRGGLNTASTTCVEFTAHKLLFVVEQLLDHPPKMELAVDVAVSVTVVPTGNAETQSVGQLMPLGLLVTVPLPLPESVITRLKTCEGAAGNSKTTPQPDTQFEVPPELAVP